MNEVTQLVRFAESAKGFDVLQKLKLILFTVGVKPNTYVVLKISPKNLEEKAHFESHLKQLGIIFEVGKPKSYEEITEVKSNIVKWEIKGTWYGYDLFSNKKSQQLFHKYKLLLRQQKHAEADELAGKLYGYPHCCTEEYSKEHDTDYLKQKYTYCKFYERMHAQDKKFPFIFHYICNKNCKRTIALNKKYSAAIKRHAPNLWNNFSAEQTSTADLIVDSESDVFDDNAKSIWQNKDCHDYSLVSAEPIHGNYYLLSYLAKSLIPRGTIAKAKIKIKYNYADVELLSFIDFVGDLHHERKLLGLP